MGSFYSTLQAGTFACALNNTYCTGRTSSVGIPCGLPECYALTLCFSLVGLLRICQPVIALCIPRKQLKNAPIAIFMMNFTPFVPPGKYETV